MFLSRLDQGCGFWEEDHRHKMPFPPHHIKIRACVVSMIYRCWPRSPGWGCVCLSSPHSELCSWEGSLLFFSLSVKSICWSWVRTGLLLGSCQAFFITSLLGWPCLLTFYVGSKSQRRIFLSAVGVSGLPLLQKPCSWCYELLVSPAFVLTIPFRTTPSSVTWNVVWTVSPAAVWRGEPQTGDCALKQRSPTFLGPGTSFVEDNPSMVGGEGHGLGMSQVHCMYCALYFYSCYISSTSDHPALGPGGWGPLWT